MEIHNEKKQKCPYINCGATFNRPYKLAQHLLLHKNIRTFICSIGNCSRSYTSKSHLDRHMKTKHLKKQNNVIYSCPTCLRAYTNRQNLKRHIKVKHVLNVPFYCDICKMEFRKKHLLTSHMYQHTGVKSFNCEKCHQDFITLQEKKKHMKFHKIYNCDECSLNFNLWSALQHHKKIEHAKSEFICNECGRKFKSRGHIVRHVKVHLQEYIKVFQCPYDNCLREYSRNSNLKQHILIKHVKIKHECQQCNVKLCTKAALERHIKNHSNPKIKKQVKTLATGRKSRKDIGAIKNLSALKLAGLKQPGTILDDVDTLVPTTM